VNAPDPRTGGRFHYVGIGGSGMSALAQFQVMLGGAASGSDRAFDRGERAEWRRRLERLGIVIVEQDGRGISDDCAAVVVSTAVEDQIEDVRRARAVKLPIVHRSELLAHHVATHRTIAVSGTSGKSTVVAMVFEMLRAAGLDPSVITGGDLVSLRDQGLWGNAWHGASNHLVVEADESDSSIVRYQPAIGVVVNLQRDHMEMDEALEAFSTFRHHTSGAFVVGEAENLAMLAAGAIRFGFGEGVDVRATAVEVDALGSRFEVSGVRFELPVPGRHNVENALAAIAVCQAAGVALEDMRAPLSGFRGVGRRFETIGRVRGIEVIDDFAHNPNKIRAALTAAQMRAPRVHAIFQPHGYGPTRFHRAALVETFATCLRAQDHVWLLDIFYAGGTTTRDISSAEIAAEMAARGAPADYAPSRTGLAERIAAVVEAGDLVLVMGARDPTLTDFACALLAAIAPSGASPKAATVEDAR